MSSFRDLDALLCARGPFAPESGVVPWTRLALGVGLCGGACGAAMASYGGPGLQMIASAVKVPLLIVVSTALALPSLFVVNTVNGLREDFPAVLRGILASQATVAVALGSTAPLLLLVYVSGASYPVAKAACGLLFLVSSLAGQGMLAVHLRPLVRANPRHRGGRRLWWFLYALVTIQLAWVLRPFIGDPELPVELWREDAWGNAYVELARLLREVLAG